MEKVIIVRYCEIHLKGKNRGYFERVFMNNMEKALSGIRHEIRRPSGRYLVEKFDEARAEDRASSQAGASRPSQASVHTP